jgi:Mlc titration factor MtfA (ptsG expression regulator)
LDTPLLLLIGSAVGVALWLALWPVARSRRRLEISRREPPPEWLVWLQRRLPLYRDLPDDIRARLHGLIAVFLREKNFVGCNELTVTDEMRVTIAAYACLLVVGRPEVPRAHFYDDLLAILVYPTPFIAPQSHHDENGLVSESEDVLSGQAWDSHRIILSWQDVEESAEGAHHNVVLHEFAHYLDMEDESMDGAPGLGGARAFEEWSEVFWDEYDRLCAQIDAGEHTLLDPYAAAEPAEFFAVVTETFFMQPRELEARHPGLYEQLRKYYRLHPAAWATSGTSACEDAPRS